MSWAQYDVAFDDQEVRVRLNAVRTSLPFQRYSRLKWSSRVTVFFFHDHARRFPPLSVCPLMRIVLMDADTGTSLTLLLSQCTRGVAASANTPDYARILEFCDLINRDGSGRAAAIAAQQLVTIMKEEQSYLILFLTLHVIERTRNYST